MMGTCKPSANSLLTSVSAMSGTISITCDSLSRTNQHFTLKENPLTRTALDDFVACYKPANRHQRQESERFKRYTYNAP